MTNAQVARALRMAALVAASLGLAHAASAQQPSQEQIAAIRAACPADYGAHCVGITPGGPRALACLRQHLAELSAPCQQAVNAAIAGTQRRRPPLRRRPLHPRRWRRRNGRGRLANKSLRSSSRAGATCANTAAVAEAARDRASNACARTPPTCRRAVATVSRFGRGC
jgi:hypothetical protein